MMVRVDDRQGVRQPGFPSPLWGGVRGGGHDVLL